MIDSTVANYPATAERIAELGEILAAGLMRVLAPKSSPVCADVGESSLDNSAAESGAPTPTNRSTANG